MLPTCIVGLFVVFSQRSRFHPAQTRFGRDRKGGVIIVFALLLPVLVGFIGLGVEVTYWFSKKRDLQAAADAAALAGSYELAEDRASNMLVVATREATGNGWESAGGSITVRSYDYNTTYPASGSYTTDKDAVEVVLTRAENLMFAGWFMSGGVTINARAVGLAVANASDACILALGSANASGALLVSGSAAVTISGCSASTNSTDSAAVTTTAGLSVDCVYSAGGISGTPTTTACSGPKSNQPAVTDPYEAAITKPSDSDFSTCSAYSGAASITTSDSPLCSLSVTSALTMAAGTYYIDRGDVRLTGGGVVDATAGVTIVFGDSTGGNNCGGLTITGNSNLDITAPTSGNFSGITLYRSSECDDEDDFNFGGNNDSVIIGAVYNPSATIKLTGSGVVGSTCLQLISDIVLISGNGTLGGDCDSAGTLELSAGGSGSLVEQTGDLPPTTCGEGVINRG